MKPEETQSLGGLKIKENEQDMVYAYNRSTWEMKLGESGVPERLSSGTRLNSPDT